MLQGSLNNWNNPDELSGVDMACIKRPGRCAEAPRGGSLTVEADTSVHFDDELEDFEVAATNNKMAPNGGEQDWRLGNVSFYTRWIFYPAMCRHMIVVHLRFDEQVCKISQTQKLKGARLYFHGLAIT